jgi:hypothetical protein
MYRVESLSLSQVLIWTDMIMKELPDDMMLYVVDLLNT